METQLLLDQACAEKPRPLQQSQGQGFSGVRNLGQYIGLTVMPSATLPTGERT